VLVDFSAFLWRLYSLLVLINGVVMFRALTAGLLEEKDKTNDFGVIKHMIIDRNARYPSCPVPGYIAFNRHTFYVDLIMTANLSNGSNMVTLLLSGYHSDPKTVDFVNTHLSGKDFVVDLPNTKPFESKSFQGFEYSDLDQRYIAHVDYNSCCNL